MVAVNAIIRVNIDATAANAGLASMAGQMSKFNKGMIQGSAAMSAAQVAAASRAAGALNRTGQWIASTGSMMTSTGRMAAQFDKGTAKSFGSFARNTSMMNRSMTANSGINQLAASRVRALQTQYTALGREVDGVQQVMKAQPTGMVANRAWGSSAEFAAQRAILFRRNLTMGANSMINWGKNTQWAGRQMMVGMGVPMALAAVGAVRSFKDIEAASISFKRVYGDATTTAGEKATMLGKIQGGVAQEMTKYGVAVADTLDVAAKAAATGQKGDDLIAATRETMRIATLGNMDYMTALEGTIATQTAFGVSAKGMTRVTDFMNAAENQTILSMEDMSKAVPRVAPVIRGLGGDVEDLGVLMTALRAGGVTAEQGANALKSGLASLINPTSTATEAMDSFGIPLDKIVKANKGDLIGTVQSFGKALGDLPKFQQQQALESLFGKYQYARMGALFRNINGKQARETARLSKANDAELAKISAAEQETISESPLKKFEGAIERLKAAAAPLGGQILSGLTPLIDMFAGITDFFATNDVAGKVLLWGAAFAGLAGLGTMLTGVFANFFGTMIKGGQMMHRAGRFMIGKPLPKYNSIADLEATAAQKQLAAAAEGATASLYGEKGAVTQLAAALNAMNAELRESVGLQAAASGGVLGGARKAVATSGTSAIPGAKGTSTGTGTGSTTSAVAVPRSGGAVPGAPRGNQHDIKTFLMGRQRSHYGSATNEQAVRDYFTHGAGKSDTSAAAAAVRSGGTILSGMTVGLSANTNQAQGENRAIPIPGLLADVEKHGGAMWAETLAQAGVSPDRGAASADRAASAFHAQVAGLQATGRHEISVPEFNRMLQETAQKEFVDKGVMTQEQFDKQQQAQHVRDGTTTRVLPGLTGQTSWKNSTTQVGAIEDWARKTSPLEGGVLPGESGAHAIPEAKAKELAARETRVAAAQKSIDEGNAKIKEAAKAQRAAGTTARANVAERLGVRPETLRGWADPSKAIGDQQSKNILSRFGMSQPDIDKLDESARATQAQAKVTQALADETKQVQEKAQKEHAAGTQQVAKAEAQANKERVGLAKTQEQVAKEATRQADIDSRKASLEKQRAQRVAADERRANTAQAAATKEKATAAAKTHAQTQRDLYDPNKMKTTPTPAPKPSLWNRMRAGGVFGGGTRGMSPEDKSAYKEQRAGRLSAVSGKLMGLGMAADAVTMGLALTGHEVPVWSHMLGMGLMTMAMFPGMIEKPLTLLANPVTAGLAAVVAATAGLVLAYNYVEEQARDAGIAHGNFVVAGGQALKGFEEATQKQSLYTIAMEKRAAKETGSTTADVQKADEIAATEYGKQLSQSYADLVNNGNLDAANAQLANQLATGVLQKVLTAGEASAMTESLVGGVQGQNVRTQLESMIGKKGQLIEQNPYGFALNQLGQSSKAAADALKASRELGAKGVDYSGAGKNALASTADAFLPGGNADIFGPTQREGVPFWAAAAQAAMATVNPIATAGGMIAGLFGANVSGQNEAIAQSEGYASSIWTNADQQGYQSKIAAEERLQMALAARGKAEEAIQALKKKDPNGYKSSDEYAKAAKAYEVANRVVETGRRSRGIYDAGLAGASQQSFNGINALLQGAQHGMPNSEQSAAALNQFVSTGFNSLNALYSDSPAQLAGLSSDVQSLDLNSFGAGIAGAEKDMGLAAYQHFANTGLAPGGINDYFGLASRAGMDQGGAFKNLSGMWQRGIGGEALSTAQQNFNDPNLKLGGKAEGKMAEQVLNAKDAQTMEQYNKNMDGITKLGPKMQQAVKGAFGAENLLGKNPKDIQDIVDWAKKSGNNASDFEKSGVGGGRGDGSSSDPNKNKDGGSGRDSGQGHSTNTDRSSEFAGIGKGDAFGNKPLDLSRTPGAGLGGMAGARGAGQYQSGGRFGAPGAGQRTDPQAITNAMNLGSLAGKAQGQAQGKAAESAVLQKAKASGQPLQAVAKSQGTQLGHAQGRAQGTALQGGMKMAVAKVGQNMKSSGINKALALKTDTRSATSDIAKLSKAGSKLGGAAGKSIKFNVDAKDNASKKLDNVKKKANGVKGIKANLNIGAKDQASGKISKVKAKAAVLKGIKAVVNMTAKDNATPTLDKIGSSIGAAVGRAASQPIVLNAQDNATGVITPVIGLLGVVGAMAPAPAINAVDNASATIGNVISMLASIPPLVTSTIVVNKVGGDAAGGSVAGYATGGKINYFPRRRGKISGQGGPEDDKIPSMLSNGEFVIRAKSVDKYGTGFMNKVNSGLIDPDSVAHLSGGTSGYQPIVRSTRKREDAPEEETKDKPKDNTESGDKKEKDKGWKDLKKAIEKMADSWVVVSKKIIGHLTPKMTKSKTKMTPGFMSNLLETGSPNALRNAFRSEKKAKVLQRKYEKQKKMESAQAFYAAYAEAKDATLASKTRIAMIKENFASNKIQSALMEASDEEILGLKRLKVKGKALNRWAKAKSKATEQQQQFEWMQEWSDYKESEKTNKRNSQARTEAASKNQQDIDAALSMTDEEARKYAEARSGTEKKKILERSKERIKLEKRSRYFEQVDAMNKTKAYTQRASSGAVAGMSDAAVAGMTQEDFETLQNLTDPAEIQAFKDGLEFATVAAKNFEQQLEYMAMSVGEQMKTASGLMDEKSQSIMDYAAAKGEQAYSGVSGQTYAQTEAIMARKQFDVAGEEQTQTLAQRRIADINEEYDKQTKLLDKVAQAQQIITNLEKGRLSIASALSQGDIAGAAAAMQEQRAAQAQAGIDMMKQSLADEQEAKVDEQQDIIDASQDRIDTLNDEIYTMQHLIDQYQTQATIDGQFGNAELGIPAAGDVDKMNIGLKASADYFKAISDDIQKNINNLLAVNPGAFGTQAGGIGTPNVLTPNSANAAPDKHEAEDPAWDQSTTRKTSEKAQTKAQKIGRQVLLGHKWKSARKENLAQQYKEELKAKYQNKALQVSSLYNQGEITQANEAAAAMAASLKGEKKRAIAMITHSGKGKKKKHGGKTPDSEDDTSASSVRRRVVAPPPSDTKLNAGTGGPQMSIMPVGMTTPKYKVAEPARTADANRVAEKKMEYNSDNQQYHVTVNANGANLDAHAVANIAMKKMKEVNRGKVHHRRK